MEDQIDVGISAPLQSGLGLFDPLNAVSPGPALRLACLERQGGIDSKRLFHVPRLSRDGLGPLCTPAVRHSRRATLESPNLTACLLAQALNSLVWLVLYDDACECLISLTLPSDSSAAPGLRLPGWLHCLGGFRPLAVACAARQTPAPIEYLLRKAGLSQKNHAEQWQTRPHVAANGSSLSQAVARSGSRRRSSWSLRSS